MNAYARHEAGDCWPDSCPMCAEECPTCSQWRHECTCPHPDEETTDDE